MRAFREGYFVIDGFDAVLRVLEEADLAAIHPGLKGTEGLDPAA